MYIYIHIHNIRYIDTICAGQFPSKKNPRLVPEGAIAGLRQPRRDAQLLVLRPLNEQRWGPRAVHGEFRVTRGELPEMVMTTACDGKWP